MTRSYIGAERLCALPTRCQPSWHGYDAFGHLIISVGAGELLIAQHDRNGIDSLWTWQESSDIYDRLHGHEAYVWIIRPYRRSWFRRGASFTVQPTDEVSARAMRLA